MADWIVHHHFLLDWLHLRWLLNSRRKKQIDKKLNNFNCCFLCFSWWLQLSVLPCKARSKNRPHYILDYTQDHKFPGPQFLYIHAPKIDSKINLFSDLFFFYYLEKNLFSFFKNKKANLYSFVICYLRLWNS